MDPEGGSAGSCYYSVLGIRRDASSSDIRTAYRKLALVRLPSPKPSFSFLSFSFLGVFFDFGGVCEEVAPGPVGEESGAAGEAKRRFQQIQEAYSVLSDASKKSMYDAGFYDPMEEDQDFCDFMQEMVSMMNNVGDECRGPAEDVRGHGLRRRVYFDFNRQRKCSVCPKKSPVAGSNGGAARRSISSLVQPPNAFLLGISWECCVIGVSLGNLAHIDEAEGGGGAEDSFGRNVCQ
ncbi:hypothetical protein CK203_021240 [Vitis vinifera]|uniref:J domain-containing protein n=1 Tax=Vitis vinifera TaxID=29760 RepID=A0A438IMI6_VITVI|nr:hypothetical protein CK203_021240 [Vitis vinifera]